MNVVLIFHNLFIHLIYSKFKQDVQIITTNQIFDLRGSHIY